MSLLLVPVLDGHTLRKLHPDVYLVLYPPLAIPIGHKGASALPPQEDLVLYHPIFVSRDQQNQPLIRLGEGYLVLYHALTRSHRRGLLLLTPLFDIGIPPLKIPRVVLTPGPLSHGFTLLLARLPRTCLLPLSYSRIRHKEPAAKQTPLPQG